MYCSSTLAEYSLSSPESKACGGCFGLHRRRRQSGSVSWRVRSFGSSRLEHLSRRSLQRHLSPSGISLFHRRRFCASSAVGLGPGARELLDALRPRYRLAALSNSNAVHWDRNSTELGVTGLFDAAYSSHQLGCHKPEPVIYREALARLGVPANRVAFFDDVES